MNFFPRGLTNFFKNLENVYTAYGKLQEIKKYDLAQFGVKLKLFGAPYNEIRVIEGDLFVNNPNLEEIYLEGNKIFHIDSGAFDGLQQLNTLYLQLNPCTTDPIVFERSAVQTISEVQKSCNMPNSTTTTTLPPTTQTPTIITPAITDPPLTITITTPYPSTTTTSTSKKKIEQLQSDLLIIFSYLFSLFFNN
jgi:Leucine-rich repeat (LRR) protein